MYDLMFIVGGSILMSLVAMVGGLTTFLKPAHLERLVLPMVSLAAGTLLGGAFFHMIPEGMELVEAHNAVLWIIFGFVFFLGVEQFFHWHNTHHVNENSSRKPAAYLILIGDAVHNFLDGLGITSTFLLDHRAGVAAWFAAVAHEIPQELGDFGVLIHSGMPKRRALMWNLLSALTFPLGALSAYIAAHTVDVSGLVLFGAGNFIYIAASDLIPEIKSPGTLKSAVEVFIIFIIGLAAMFILAKFAHA